jgi:hypothetical protein
MEENKILGEIFMKKTLFILLVFIIVFSFSINAQSNKFPVEIIEHFQGDGEETLARSFTYEIKKLIRNSEIMELNDGTGRRISLLVSTLPYSDFSNNAFIFSVFWLMIDSNSNELPIFVDSTLGYAGKDVYEEFAKSIFIHTEDLFREIM